MSRRRPPTSPEERTQQRLAVAESGPPPWRGPIQTSDGAPQRIVRGEGTGTMGSAITAGGGWSYIRWATGVYIITFTTAFSGVPTVTCSAMSTAIRVAVLQTPTSATGFQVQTYNPATGTFEDTAFSFIAVGPA